VRRAKCAKSAADSVISGGLGVLMKRVGWFLLLLAAQVGILQRHLEAFLLLVLVFSDHVRPPLKPR
jgi:hypothetical protein